jgi:hypothetical protein
MTKIRIALLLLVVAAGAGCAMRRSATSAMRTIDSADNAVDTCAVFACER